MARRKNPFVSAFGTAFAIFKALADEVLALGGSDDDLRRILTDATLREEIAKALVGKNQPEQSSVSAVSPKLLARVGTIALSGPTNGRFRVSEHFVVDTSSQAIVPISGLGENFQSWFGGLVEEPLAGLAPLQVDRLLQASPDPAIMAELGGEQKARISITEFFVVLRAQRKGETSHLLTNSWANIGYALDKNGVLRVVNAYWCRDGWSVRANPVEYPIGWNAGDQVLSRNSDPVAN